MGLLERLDEKIIALEKRVAELERQHKDQPVEVSVQLDGKTISQNLEESSKLKFSFFE